METLRISVTSSREICLTLPNQKPRKIGWLSEDGQTFHTQCSRELHSHRQNGSVGFNYELIRDGKFKWVVVHILSGNELVTKRIHILENGIFLDFKGQGYDKQLYLPLREFGKEKTEGIEVLLKGQEEKKEY